MRLKYPMIDTENSETIDNESVPKLYLVDPDEIMAAGGIEEYFKTHENRQGWQDFGKGFDFTEEELDEMEKICRNDK